MKKRHFLRFAAINLLPLLFILFQFQTISAQHPCDNFPVTTCTVPTALETWTVSDNNTTATIQAGEPLYGAGTVNKTLWIAWTAPKTRVYSLDTRGTNPNNTLLNDTILRVFKGGNTFGSLTLLSENEDWSGVSPCQQFFTTLRGTEQINSSCTILYATAGTKYYFQMDGDLLPPIGFPNFGPYLLNLKPLIEPTSSNVSVSGRVSDSSGNAISRVSVKLIKPNGEVLRTATNAFGFYRFDGIEIGQTYILQADSKRFTFQNNPRALFVNEDLDGQNLTAIENPN